MRPDTVFSKNIKQMLVICLFALSAFIFTAIFTPPPCTGEETADMDELFSEYGQEENISSLRDPLYWFNYGMYTFNDKLYFWVLRPVAKGYKAVTPLCLRKGIDNFFYNTIFPVRFVNSILQGKFKAAISEVNIFVVNTIVGCLGFARPAQDVFDMKNADEDLGQTLGSYSLGDGFYLVLPLLGPSTLRDAVGRAGDYFLTPVNYVEPDELYYGLRGEETINSTSLKIGDYEALKDAALDPYIALKDAYLQYRKKSIAE